MIIEQTQRDIFEDLHISAIKDRKLFMAEIDVTNVCNCKCPFCFQGTSHQDSEKVLSFEEIVHIMDDLKELGCYYLSFSGGDPFCRKDFVSILSEAKKRGFYVTFVSHLQLASDKDIDIINELGIERVLVSFHSYTPEGYSKIFNVDQEYYWRALENIKRLHNAGTPVGIAVTISEQNATELFEIRELFMNLGIPCANIRYNPLLEGKTPIEKIRGGHELCNYLSQHKDLKTNVLSRLRTRRLSFFCSAGRSSCVIHPNGDVAPCGFINRIAGNVKLNSLKDIWENSEVFAEIRNLNDCDFEKCKSCELNDTCPICLGNNLNENGNYCITSDHYCEFRKGIYNALTK